MFRNVLIATDGSELAEKAVQLGFSVAKQMNAKTTVMRATPPPTAYVGEGIAVTPPPEVREEIARVVGDQFARIRKRASEVGVACETFHVENDLPWQAILDTAKRQGCDLIVMASHGRSGFSAAFLGSETQKVLAQSTIPVLVCR
jgi:nucleotide-binding universal stress UspA family protein